MNPDSTLLLDLLLLFLLILCNAFFAMSEIAIVTLNDNKLRLMVKNGDKSAITISKLVEHPSKFLATIQFGSKLSGFCAAAVAAITFAPIVQNIVANAVYHPSLARGIAVFLIIFVLAYFTIVLGELVPKRIAMHHFERISKTVAPILLFIYRLLSPIISFLSISSNAVLKLFGIDASREIAEVTEEEIRMMVEVGEERGSIEESEKEMINSIFEFDDRTVDEMMTHRTEICWIAADSSLAEVVKTFTESGYSRIPVCDDSLDKIVGILYSKDLLPLLQNHADNGEFKLNDYLREPLYILESNTCSAALQEFRSKKMQIAVVVDEYGGTSGLVSMEDLLESIVGNIQDEYDDDEDESISKLGEDNYVVDGLTTLEDIDKYFELSISGDEEIETISGYVVDKLERIPSDDEHPHVDIDGWRFVVLEMEDRRISRLEVTKVADAADADNTAI